METAVLSPSEAPSEANQQTLEILREINVRLAAVSKVGTTLDAMVEVVETIDGRLQAVEMAARDTAKAIEVAHTASNGKLADAMHEFTLLERGVGKLIQPIADLKAVQDKLLETDPTAQVKSIAQTSEALIKVSATLNDIGESLVTRLATIPQAEKADQAAIQKLESARLGLVQAANDIITVAQLKQKVIDHAPTTRRLAIFTALGLSGGLCAATLGFALWKPGVDTNAEAWGRHLLADKTFAACLNQSQAPTGPAACSIRFRPDPTVTGEPKKR